MTQGFEGAAAGGPEGPSARWGFKEARRRGAGGSRGILHFLLPGWRAPSCKIQRIIDRGTPFPATGGARGARLLLWAGFRLLGLKGGARRVVRGGDAGAGGALRASAAVAEGARAPRRACELLSSEAPPRRLCRR